MLPLRQLRAIAIAFKRGRRGLQQGLKAVKQGSQESSHIQQTFAAAKVRRLQQYGKVEEMGVHAKRLLMKHASLANRRSGSRFSTSVSRQQQYVKHVQKTMKKTLKASNAKGPYGHTLISQVKTAKNLVRRTQ